MRLDGIYILVIFKKQPPSVFHCTELVTNFTEELVLDLPCLLLLPLC